MVTLTRRQAGSLGVSNTYSTEENSDIEDAENFFSSVAKSASTVLMLLKVEYAIFIYIIIWYIVRINRPCFHTT